MGSFCRLYKAPRVLSQLNALHPVTYCHDNCQCRIHRIWFRIASSPLNLPAIYHILWTPYDCQLSLYVRGNVECEYWNFIYDAHVECSFWLLYQYFSIQLISQFDFLFRNNYFGHFCRICYSWTTKNQVLTQLIFL